jgi:hypothetical protein
MSDDNISEEDCAVCRDWPAKDRWALRQMINRMPLQEEVCVECQMAFWRSVGLFNEPTKH